MSMPHVCRCGICNREMTGWKGDNLPGAVFGDPRLSAAQGPGVMSMQYWCTKHGQVNGIDCEQCRAAKTEAKHQQD